MNHLQIPAHRGFFSKLLGLGKLGSRKTILVVEHNELNMKLFRELLHARGHTVLETKHGLEELNLVRTHKPGLILIDIVLREISGLEAAKWIREDDDLQLI